MSEQESVPNTMRAIYLPPSGSHTPHNDDGSPSPSSLLYTSTYPTPTPSATQYLLQIDTTSPTPHELLSTTTTTATKIPSREICGIVISTPSSDVCRRYPKGPKFKIGDEVFGLLSPEGGGGGGAAGYTVAVEEEMAFKPKNVSAAEAAVLPLGGLIAWQALEGAGLRSSLIEEAEGGGEEEVVGKGGEFIRVLVLGGLSVVGRYVVQLLRANSAPFDGGIRRRRGRKKGGMEDRREIFWICATCSTGDDEAFLHDELGVNEVVVLEKNQADNDISGKLSQIFKEREWPPVDVVLDCENHHPRSSSSSSNRPDTAVSLASSPHIVRKDGGWEVLKLDLPEWSVEMVDVVDGSKKGAEPSTTTTTREGGKNRSWAFNVEPNGLQLAEIAEVVEMGEIKPVVDREFGLYEAGEAMEMIDRGVEGGKEGIRGKVVLRVNC